MIKVLILLQLPFMITVCHQKRIWFAWFFLKLLWHCSHIIDLGSEVGVADGKVTRYESSLWKVFSQPQLNPRNKRSAILKNHPQRLALKFPMVIHKGVIFEHMSPVGYIFTVATVSAKFTGVHLHIRYAVSLVIRRNYTVRVTHYSSLEAKALRLR